MKAQSKNAPRGVRNNNPGNIRHGEKWQGLAPAQTDAAFATFATAVWGIRALARVLITYQDKHQLSTVRALIGRWAPPNENNTNAYVAAVARSIGVDADDVIDVHQYDVMQPLVVAIIKHENGVQPYSKDEIDEGLRRAGVVRVRSAARDGEILSTAAAGAGTATVAGTALYAEVAQVSTDLRSQGRDTGSTHLLLAGSGLSLLAIGVLAFVVIKKWRARR